MKKFNHIWIFSDSIAGHEIQSKALASKLTDKVSLFHCSIRQPWLSFAPRILPRFGRNIIWEKSQPELKQSPDVIITCGRRMAAIGKYFKRQLNCKHIQILNPGDNPNKYDLLICPQHDGLKADNLITTQGSLHAVTVESLDKIKCPKNQPNKSLCLLLGNPSKEFFTNIHSLANKIEQNFAEYAISICGSRRTPDAFYLAIKNAFPDANTWFKTADGNNPYMSLLACSDIIIVTADSINMVSEACATNKPVIAVGRSHISPKHTRFIQSIESRLSTFEELKQVSNPLKTLEDTVQEILNRL